MHKVIAVTRRLPEVVEQRLAATYSVSRFEDDRVLDGDGIVSLCKEADGLLCSPTEGISAQVVAALPPSLKIIATYSAGYDHIDIAAAADKDIVVTNTPDVLTSATAEVAVFLILAVLRRARESQRLIELGDWKRWTPTELLGTGIEQAHVGLIGMGRIAAATAVRLAPFGCRISYWARSDRGNSVGGVKVSFEADLRQMLSKVDVISLHVPGSAEMAGLIGRDEVALMRKGSAIVNTARGSLVDDDAVISALRSGHLSGVGLDVFNNEPGFDKRYLDVPSAFLLPHIGSATQYARTQMGIMACDNLDAFFAGAELPSPVRN